MPASNRLLNRAIQFSQAGNHADARRMLSSVLTDDPENESAWLWYANTFPTEEERMRVFTTALQRCPDMPLVKRASRQLIRARESRKEQPVPRPREGRRYGLLLFTAVALAGFLLVFGSVFLFQNGQIEQFSQKNRNLQTALVQYQAAMDRLTLDLLKLTGRFNNLQASYQTLQGQHADLQNQHVQLTQEHQGLEKEYGNLKTSYETLHNEHADLQNRHQQLTQEYQDLSSRDQDLQNTYNSLNNDYRLLTEQNQALQNQYNALNGRYIALQNISIVPPYITITGRTARVAFYKTDNQTILSWNIPFEALERDIERGYEARQEINFFNRMTLEGDGDNEYRVVDFSKYVDAGTFRDVIGDLYRQSPDEAAFLREVWHIVAQLTTYSTEIGEQPRFPLETLLAGGGDCEDTSILFASMVKAAPVDWKVSLVYVDANNTNQLGRPNHVIVSVKTSNGDYLVETTNKNVMLPYPNGVAGWTLALP